MNADDHAILIGINDYPALGEDGVDASLHGPANDVDAVKAWLLDSAGGNFASEENIQVLKSRVTASDGLVHPTADEIEVTFGRLNALARENQSKRRGLRVGRRLYIFVSGHGFSPGRQRGCLFAANASATLGTFNVHATGWLNWLQDAGYFREYVLWMDCCMNRVSFLQPRDPALTPVNATDPPAASFIAFAAQRPLKAVEIAIAEDGSKIHGAFTWALLEGLRGAAADVNGRVTGRSLGDWIRNAMCARMTDLQRQDGDVAKEPEVVQEDSRLIFARGVRRPSFPVTLTLPPEASGKLLRIWSGIPPRAQELSAAAVLNLQLPPGLYVVEVPAAGLRQGFDLTSAATVDVTEAGDPVAAPADDATVFALAIDPNDAAAEIFVIDSRFSLVDGGAARLLTPLPFGLFKIKTRIGRSLTQRVILLDRDRPVLLPTEIARPVASVMPLSGTPRNQNQEAGRRAALAASMQLRGADAGHPSTLMVMARTADSQDVPQDNTAPWRGVSVVDADGRPVITMATDGQRDSEQASHAWAVRELPAGVYFLRQQLDQGPTIEQSLIVGAAWCLEVYILRRLLPGTTAPNVRPRVSVMMRRPGQEPDAALEKIIETARLALADERRILNAELEDILLRHCANPVAGMIGGHLLLVERDRDPGRDMTLLDVVVGRLREMLGDSHPDVAALGQQCAAPALRRFGPLTGPPMFQRSWKLLAEAAQRRPACIPPGMWERTIAQTALPPFLVWAVDDAVRKAARTSLAQALFGPASGAAGASGVAAARNARMRAARLQVPPAGLQALLAERAGQGSGPRS